MIGYLTLNPWGMNLIYSFTIIIYIWDVRIFYMETGMMWMVEKITPGVGVI